jgi:hypothetical protein
MFLLIAAKGEPVDVVRPLVGTGGQLHIKGVGRAILTGKMLFHLDCSGADISVQLEVPGIRGQILAALGAIHLYGI